MKSRRRVKTVKKQKRVKVKRTKVGRKRSRSKPSKRKPRKKTIKKTIKSMKVVKGGTNSFTVDDLTEFKSLNYLSKVNKLVDPHILSIIKTNKDTNDEDNRNTFANYMKNYLEGEMYAKTVSAIDKSITDLTTKNDTFIRPLLVILTLNHTKTNETYGENVKALKQAQDIIWTYINRANAFTVINKILTEDVTNDSYSNTIIPYLKRFADILNGSNASTAYQRDNLNTILKYNRDILDKLCSIFTKYKILPYDIDYKDYITLINNILLNNNYFKQCS